MIPFNKPPLTGKEQEYLLDALGSPKLSGDGKYGLMCNEWFERQLLCKRALLTPSCTQALEMAAILLDIAPGDEVIMPSYTFVSTANAFVVRGAKIVFVDIRPDTMNMDENKIEAAITSKTRAIVPVHYAGVACEMDEICAIAAKYNLVVVEDAAQAMMSRYKGRNLGVIGELGTYSFHETKNLTSGGEGGVLLVNDPGYSERSEIIREKGTNRSKFFRGMVDKYSWVDLGSSYLPSELQAAYLWAQLNSAEDITKNRLNIWEHYNSSLIALLEKGIGLPFIPEHCSQNGHMFYLKLRDIDHRKRFIKYLNERGVMGVFHYVPLHSSPAGKSFGEFCGEDVYTTIESEKIVRLPLWYGLSRTTQDSIIDVVLSFPDW